MKTSTEKTGNKDEAFRKFALNGTIWKVILYVGFPLALYQSLNQIFKILDTMMAAHINATAASTVAYLSQLSLILNALGNGLAIGSSLKISEAYGAGDYELVKKRVNTLFALCGILSLSILVLVVPFINQILRIAKTPEEFIVIGKAYFTVELFTMVLIFFNNVYIAIERTRGNSKRILHLNLFVILVKLGLTALFIYVLKQGITMIAIATMISQLIITIVAIRHLSIKESAFTISLKHMILKKDIVLPMIQLSIPISIEKSAFSLGKAVVNSMTTLYGPLTVGALGISNNLSGINATPQNGFQDGAAAIISQNLGAGKVRRALDAFKAVLLINLLCSIFLLIPALVFAYPLTGLFVKTDDTFHQLLYSVFLYDVWSTLPLAINSSVLALFYGFGRTKVTLIINFCRIFLFRIPILWFFQNYTNTGSSSVGIVMVISNVLVGIFSLLLAVFFIRNTCKDHHISFWKKS